MSYLGLFFRFRWCGAIAFTVLCILLLTTPSCLLLFLIKDAPNELFDAENMSVVVTECTQDEESDLP